MEVLGVNIPVWIVLATLLLLLVLYKYFGNNYNIWKAQGIVCQRRIPLLGSYFDFLRKPLHEAEMDRYKEMGRIYGIYEGRTPCLSVGDPDLLRSVLVKDFPTFPHGRLFHSGDEISDNMVFSMEGEDWKRVRMIMTPAFTTGRLKRICGILNYCSKNMVQNVMKESKDGRQPVNLKSLFDSFAADVIANGLFGLALDSYKDTNSEFLKMGRKVFQKSFDWRFLVAFFFQEQMERFKISFFPPDSMDYFKRVGIQLIKQRREQGKPRNDMLQILMDASKEVSAQEELENDDKDLDVGREEGNSPNATQPTFTNKSLTEVELIANSVMFLLGGFEGVSVTLSLLIFNVALHPECQERLIEEIDKFCENREEIDYDCIREMTYLDCFIKESLRMFPTAFRTEREVAEDCELGDTGIKLPKGSVVTVPIYPMHHDPEFFPDPEEFTPERFSPENKSNIKPYTYLPFGAGPRNCLGMRFAMMEIKVCVVNMLRTFRVKFCLESSVPPNYRLFNFFFAPKTMVLKIVPRTDVVY